MARALCRRNNCYGKWNRATVTFVDTDQITFPLPAGASGTGNIVVTTCGPVTSAGTFTVGAAPAITTNPSTAAQNLCIGQTPTAVSVIATGAQTLTYQWYQNTANNNTTGTLISAATVPAIYR